LRIEKHRERKYDGTAGGICLSIITETFAVSGLAYEASAETIEKKLCQLDGVHHAEVRLKDKTVRISYDDQKLTPQALISQIEACGYQAFLPEDTAAVSQQQKKAPAHDRTAWLLLGLSIAIVLSGLFIPFGFAVIILMTIGLAIGFIDEDDSRLTDERILVTSAVLAAAVFAIIEAVHNSLAWPFALSAVMILLVYHTAMGLMSRASAKARQMFETTALPARVRLANEHTESIIATSQLHKDDVIILRPGEVSPVDGTVVRGFAHVNEAALSGSEEPVEKTIGSSVYAGSSLLDGNISVRIEEVGSTTAMMKFTSAAEKTSDDHGKASPLTRTGHSLLLYLWAAAAAAFVGWYLPTRSFYLAAMSALAILASGALHAFSYISLSSVNHTSLLAKQNHIVFHSIEALRDIADTDAVYMDQDGIITSSSFIIDELTPVKGISSAHLGYTAYALLSQNTRPMARAIVQYLRKKHISEADLPALSRYSRQGRESFLKDEKGFCGSVRQCEEEGIDLSAFQDLINTVHGEGKRILFFAESRQVIGYAVAHKPLLDHIAERLSVFHEEGIELTLFASGTDAEAAYLQSHLPLDHIHVHTAREEKKKILTEGSAGHGYAVYVSEEGTNGFEGCADCCVLAHAGADIDRTDCDILYASSDLNDLHTAMTLSEQMRTSMEQKQALVIFYHIAMILLCGIVFPMFLNTALPAFIAVFGSLFCLYLSSRS
jgi:P-type E1-E2 ATPase